MKQKGVGFDAFALGARQVVYRIGGGPRQTGTFNPAAQAFQAEGGGEYLQGAGPIDLAGYSARYGGATPGVQWQGPSAERLLTVGPVLGQAFAAGRLGSAADWTGNATWQECLDYSACWPDGAGPFAEFEHHRVRPDGSSPGSPIPVDDASRLFGAVWQLPPPDGRWAINVHGGSERPVLVIHPEGSLPKVPRAVLKDLAALAKLSGTVSIGPGRQAAIARIKKFVEDVQALAGTAE